MSTTNFKYTLVYKTNSREEHDSVLKELESIGYVNRTCIIDYNQYPYIITGYVDNNGYGSYSDYTTGGRELIDSKELFIALASMRDDDELHKGEYVTPIKGNASYLQNGKLGIIDDSRDLKGNIIGVSHEDDDSDFINKDNLRKATKEEIIQHFSKKTMVKEDKNDLIFGKWKVGDTLGIPKQNYKYFCNHWKSGKDTKMEKAEFPSSGSTDIVIKSEVYEGEEYLCFDSWLESTSYFMIPKSELIKNGILTEEKTKSQEMNKKFKNKLAVTGSKHLLEAFAKELEDIGYNDYQPWNSNHPYDSHINYIKVYNGVFANHSHDCGLKLYKLPEQYQEALELAKEVEEEKLIEGKWYKIKDGLYSESIAGHLIYSKDDNCAGFWRGNWGETWCFDEKLAIPMTKEEIESLLKAEAKKRGFKEGVKFTNLYNNESKILSNLSDTRYNLAEDRFHYQYGCSDRQGAWVYYQGKWAEIIPSYYVGDWVLLSRDRCNGLNKDSVVQLMEVDESKRPTGELSHSADFMFKNPKDTMSKYLRTKASAIIRLATAEEIKNASTPDITINGYKAEFFDTYVKFGCASFHKDIFVQFDKMNTAMINSKTGRTNRTITSITLGSGLFTIEQIKEISDYYQNK